MVWHRTRRKAIMLSTPMVAEFSDTRALIAGAEWSQNSHCDKFHNVRLKCNPFSHLHPYTHTHTHRKTKIPWQVWSLSPTVVIDKQQVVPVYCLHPYNHDDKFHCITHRNLPPVLTYTHVCTCTYVSKFIVFRLLAWIQQRNFKKYGGSH